MNQMFRAILILLFFLLLSRVVLAAEWFAAPDGKATNAGSKTAPWDVISALDGTQKVAPGDTLWLRGGSYARADNKPIEIKLQGTKKQPTQVRGAVGERVTFTTGITVLEPATYLWLRDVEIAGIVLKVERISKQTGSWPDDMPKVPGGLNVYAGEDCKFINLVIHNNQGGVGWWKGSTNSEFYGCLIYDNGWKGPDRNHGHSIYAQNQNGWKTIDSCILTVPWGEGQYTMHAYSSSNAWVDNFLIENNVAYERGPFLVGGGRPSQNIRVLDNYLYNVDMRLGYGPGPNQNGEVRGNLILNGSLQLKNWQNTREENNLRIPDSPTPKEPYMIWLPNKYDSKRAHLVIYNWHKAPQIRVPAGPFLKNGERVRLLHPEKFYDKPIWQSEIKGDSFTLPVNGEFAVFVALKD